MVKVNVPKNSRHVRYCAEPSGDFDFDHRMVKYHLVFVNDSKGIRRNLGLIVENINEVSSGVNVNERLKGKVKNSDLQFLFVTLETPLNLEVLRLENLEVKLIKDSELYEREYTKIEDYVSRLYEE